MPVPASPIPELLAEEDVTVHPVRDDRPQTSAQARNRGRHSVRTGIGTYSGICSPRIYMNAPHAAASDVRYGRRSDIRLLD